MEKERKREMKRGERLYSARQQENAMGQRKIEKETEREREKGREKWERDI